MTAGRFRVSINSSLSSRFGSVDWGYLPSCLCRLTHRRNARRPGELMALQKATGGAFRGFWEFITAMKREQVFAAAVVLFAISAAILNFGLKLVDNQPPSQIQTSSNVPAVPAQRHLSRKC